MSWKIISKLKKRVEAESGATLTRRGAALRICLVYPNLYRTGMSNLGFQSVYAMLNATPDFLCERSFLPDPDEIREYELSRTPLLSLESQQPVASFDIIAFSISFERDYLHLPTIFRLAGVPCYAEGRGNRHPLVMAGGAALFLNPEPVAEFMDMICLGEAEAILPQVMSTLSNCSLPRRQLLERLSHQPGVYIPSIRDIGNMINREYLRDLDSSSTATVISTVETEFNDLHLVEISRGCPRGCRFCAAGYIYLPYRQRSLDTVISEIDTAIASDKKVGLVAAAVGDYHDIGKLCRHIIDNGGSFSVSSLRIDSLDETMIDLLVKSGHKTATLAPEGGSQRLRDLIRKGISEEQILLACERLIAKDILNLKLYFIIGLPTETDDDITQLLSLVTRIRELVVARAKDNRRLGEITVSINPFIPKPFTPLQWCGMMPQKKLAKRLALLQKGISHLPNVTLQAESLKEAMLQASLSRGDRNLAKFLVRSDETGSWRKAAQELGLDIEAESVRQIPLNEPLPWDFIGGSDTKLLKKEYCKALDHKS